MSEDIKTSESWELQLYKDPIQSLQQLLEGIKQSNKDNLITTNLINVCIEQIQTVIKANWHNYNQRYMQDQTLTALNLILGQLNQIKERFSKESYLTTATVITKPSNNDEEQLKLLIEDTRVVPKIKGMQDIAGLLNIKKILTAIVVFPIRQPQLYVGQRRCNSVLLYGPPGTGKTQLAHALAAEISGCLFAVVPSDILSRYMGQSEKIIRVLFQVVKKHSNRPTILFIDEIDGLCRRRTENEGDCYRLLKTELMCQLSSFEDFPDVFLICATNCPWDLDPAFYRRFQRQIYVPLPERPDRFELLQLFTKETALEGSSNHWAPIMEQTEGYSGSDLANVVRNACNIPIMELIYNKCWTQVEKNQYRRALTDEETTLFCNSCDLPARSLVARDVQVDDLLKALMVVKPTISSADIARYQQFFYNT